MIHRRYFALKGSKEVYYSEHVKSEKVSVNNFPRLLHVLISQGFIMLDSSTECNVIPKDSIVPALAVSPHVKTRLPIADNSFQVQSPISSHHSHTTSGKRKALLIDRSRQPGKAKDCYGPFC